MMHYPTKIKDETLIQWLNDTYNLEDVTLTFVPKGECSWGYIVAIREKPRYFLKLVKEGVCSDFPTRQAIQAQMELFHDHGFQHMQPPPKRGKGKYLNTLEDFTAQLLPYVAGKTPETLTEAQEREWGLLMARLHRCKISEKEQPVLENFGESKIKAFKALMEKVDQPIGFFSPVQSKLLQRLRDVRKTLMENLDAMEKQRADLLEKQDSKRDYVLCHGDPNSSNIIITDNDELKLVDWDGILLAPRERDLWALKDHTVAMEAYQTRMESLNVDAKPDEDLMAYYQLEWDIQEIVDFGGRILSDQQADEHNQRDYDELDKHLKGMGL
jgi:spectinomycin phosphotransferase